MVVVKIMANDETTLKLSIGHAWSVSVYNLKICSSSCFTHLVGNALTVSVWHKVLVAFYVHTTVSTAAQLAHILIDGTQ